MFKTILFVAKSWKQPKCPLTDEWIKQMWYIYTKEYYSAIKKERNSAICSHRDGPRDSHTKSDKDRQIPYDINYVWNLKIKVQMNLEKSLRDRIQTYGYQRGWGGINIYTLLFVK